MNNTFSNFESCIAYRSKRKPRRNRFIQKCQSRNVLLQGITRVCTRIRHSRGVTYPTENRVSIQKPKTISLRRSSVSRRCCIVKNCMSFQRPIRKLFSGCGGRERERESYHFTLILKINQFSLNLFFHFDSDNARYLYILPIEAYFDYPFRNNWFRHFQEIAAPQDL